MRSSSKNRHCSPRLDTFTMPEPHTLPQSNSRLAHRQAARNRPATQSYVRDSDVTLMCETSTACLCAGNALVL